MYVHRGVVAVRAASAILLGSLVAYSQACAAPAARWLIELSDGAIRVVPVKAAAFTLSAARQGLIVWSDGASEAWQYLPPSTRWAQPRRANSPPNALSLLSATRSSIAEGGQASGGMLTTQLVQLLGQPVTRGGAFLTPHHGALLNPRLTIRRRRAGNASAFPAATAVLTRGNTAIARIPFRSGQQRVDYDQILELAKQFPLGLPAGEYSLRMQEGSESSTFIVEDADWRAQVGQRSDRFAELTGNRMNPLYLQISVENLLDQLDEDGKPLVYLADALDVLESVPDQDLSVYLRRLKTEVIRRLEGENEQAADAWDDPTGIAQIDRARRLIASGNWRRAQQTLDADGLPDDPRARRLATLYRAVIQGESGMAAEAAAVRTFLQAIEELAGGDPADRFRAHNNYANFLLNQTQDRLYNHAFQIAAGVQRPLLTTLKSWYYAEQHYRAALKLADGIQPSQRAAAQVNMARLYALLADVIRTLDAPIEGDRQFACGDQAASECALRFAACVSSEATIDPMIWASAEEVQAHLAFRDGNSSSCLEHADRALQAYFDAGSLAGVEGVERLLGLVHLQSPASEPAVSRKSSQQEALRHLSISRELAELLRERIPADQFGVSQAGFFARRAYVNEQIIDLRIQDGKAAEALSVAEAAKARSLSDLLTLETLTLVDNRVGQARSADSPSLDALLERWPANVMALEYFVGSRTTWLFVVDTQGEVTAFDLLGSQRQSRELVADVRQFLSGIEGQSTKMSQRLVSGKGFDHTWQDALHVFARTLLPEGVLAQLSQADTVIVVPHHILHYFPFAALVTQRDEHKRDLYEMVRPQFLIDEQFDLVYAPSLGVWDQLRSRPDHSVQNIAAIGIVDFPSAPQLPGVEQDLQNLKAAFGERVVEVLFADKATESRAREVLARPGMVLFATHGFNQPDRPLESFLLCLPDRHHDGRLTAAELFGSDIRSELIVMSACYSGLADRSPLPGDDLFGIQRALLQSGARTIVAGLWDVHDGTGPVLMKGFFDQLAQGRSVPTALAASQRDFLKQRRLTEGDPWGHPYFWAVYTAAGDDRTHFPAN